MASRKRKRKHSPVRHTGDVSPSDGSPFVDAPLGDRTRPWLLGAVISLFVARVLFPSESAAAEGDGQVVVMLWGLLAIVWAVGAVGQQGFRIRFGWTDAAVWALIGWHTLAALVAVRHGAPRPALNMLWEWIALGLAFFLVRQLFTGPREIRAAVAVMIALAVALSTCGLYQYFYELPATRAMYEADPDGMLRDAGLSFAEGSPARQLYEDRLASLEPFATFALTNSLAAYLATWLVVAVGIGVVGFSVRNGSDDSQGISAVGTPGVLARLLDRPIWMNLLGLACLVIPIAGCLLLTKSRAGYLATMVGLGLLAVVWWLRRQTRGGIGWKHILVIALVAILLGAGVWGAAAVGGMDVEVLSEASKSLGYRVQYWQSTARMIADHPWLGCGPGQFQHVYTFYKLPEASEEIADPHNFVLEIWATAGTPAVVGMLVVLAAFVWSLCRVSATPSNPGVEGAAGGEDPSEEASADDAPGFVLGGGMAGLVLSVPIAMASLAISGEVAVKVGMVPAMITVVILAPWVWAGRMPKGLPMVGVGVLLTCLLFSGGIGRPGVSGSLWLLLALGLNTACCSPARVLSRRSSIAIFVGAVILEICCYATSYRPVLGCRSAMLAAEVDPARAQSHLEKACSADPLWARPNSTMAAHIYHRWRVDKTADGFDALKECFESAVRSAPRSASTWHHFGDLFQAMGQQTGKREQFDQALEAYRQAVGLYPTNCRYRADLARILDRTGNISGSRREADEALRLDRLTPHLDKKLDDEQRKQLLRKTLRSE